MRGAGGCDNVIGGDSSMDGHGAMKAGAALLALGSGVAFAQAPVEVNPNAHFDSNIAGVELRAAPVGGTIAWSPSDLTGRPGSGSLRISGPIGRYVLHACVHPELVVPNPFDPFGHELSARVRSVATPAIAFAEVELMFGGDDPALDGPCRRPTVGYLSARDLVAPDSTLAASSVEDAAWPDASLTFTFQKAAADIELDGWSLMIEAVPLLANGFE